MQTFSIHPFEAPVDAAALRAEVRAFLAKHQPKVDAAARANSWAVADVGFTRALAMEVATRGVTVNCLRPGWTNTRLVDWSIDEFFTLLGSNQTLTELRRLTADATTRRGAQMREPIQRGA